MKNANQILKAIMVKLGMEVKLEQMKLVDGVTIIEADVFDVGAEVFIVAEDDQKIALPIGEYELESGMMLVVQQEGVIAEIKEKVAEEVAEEEVAEETATMETAPTTPTTATTPKSIIESTSKEYKFEELEAKIVELEAKILELSKVETVEEVVELEAEPKPIVFNPENKETVEQVQVNHTRLDRIFNIINND
jgi:hypothetical protein